MLELIPGSKIWQCIKYTQVAEHLVVRYRCRVAELSYSVQHHATCTSHYKSRLHKLRTSLGNAHRFQEQSAVTQTKLMPPYMHRENAASRWHRRTCMRAITGTQEAFCSLAMSSVLIG